MKTKISNILGVGLALLMVFSLAFALVPTKVAADEGNMEWVAQPLPTGLYGVLTNGTDVTEIAVSADGRTIYAIDGNIDINLANSVYKSADGGQSWTGLGIISTVVVVALINNIAVAPDNPNAVAVTARGGAVVDQAWLSSDGGVTWAALPTTNGTGVTQAFMDIAVGPARGGTIYGRDYVLAIADKTAGIATGSLQIVGETATWTNINAIGTVDYVACAVSPNFVGDRIVFGVAADVAAGANDGSTLATYNVQNYGTVAPTLVHARVQLDPDTEDLTAVANGILAADIAVPSNYDITPGFERVYVSTSSAIVANDGVWRCDGLLAPRELGMTGIAIRSIAYSGDVATGTLFAGVFAAPGGALIATQVWSTVQPTTNLPTWLPSFKPPTGDGGLAYVRVSPNFAADKTVFAGTSSTAAGGQSAFSVSTDAGTTFNQEALIDTNDATPDVNVIDAIAYSPDGATLFVATDDSLDLSLWATPTPPSPFSWKRIYCFTGTNAALAINYATWADAPEIYFAETVTVVNTLFASYDGGNIFNARSLPVIGAAINALSVESSKVLYTAFTTNIYKSTNGGSVWSPARPGNVGNILSVIGAPGGDVLVGGTGTTGISTDGGVTFGELPPGVNPLGSYVVIPDEGYAENHYVYAGDFAAANGLFRLQVGTDSLWTNFANPTADVIVGMGMSNGALYAMMTGTGGLFGVADRTILPHDQVGDMLWGIMDVPAGTIAGANFFDVAQNKCYTANNTTGLWAYNDFYATAKTTISTPASGAVIPVDPVTGRAAALPFSWSAVGTGTGLATNYFFAIFEKSQGFPGAIIVATGAMPLPSVPGNSVYPPAIAGAPDIAYTFLAGNEYGIMIAAVNQVSGDSNLATADFMLSPFCDPIFISIEAASGIIHPPHAGPILTSPTPGAQDVDPGAAFSWAPMAGVTEYELIIALDAALTQPVAGTPVTLATSAFGPVTLEYGTDYYYAVRATAPTSSVQSIGAFRTMISPEEAIPPVTVEQPVISPAWIWAVVIIGALLVIAVLVLIMRTRRV